MQKLIAYIKSSFDEVINKVSWPKFGELQSTTLTVLVATVIFSALIFGIDKLFQFVVELIYA